MKSGLNMTEAYALQDMVRRVGLHRILVELDKICSEEYDSMNRRIHPSPPSSKRWLQAGNEIMSCALKVDKVFHGETV